MKPARLLLFSMALICIAVLAYAQFDDDQYGSCLPTSPYWPQCDGTEDDTHGGSGGGGGGDYGCCYAQFQYDQVQCYFRRDTCRQNCLIGSCEAGCEDLFDDCMSDAAHDYGFCMALPGSCF